MLVFQACVYGIVQDSARQRPQDVVVCCPKCCENASLNAEIVPVQDEKVRLNLCAQHMPACTCDITTRHRAYDLVTKSSFPKF
jgi:hypothetical protein